MSEFDSLGKRDEAGETEWDRAVKASDTTKQESIKQHIEGLAKDGKVEDLEKLVLAGFDLAATGATMAGNEEVEAFVKTIPSLKEKLSSIYEAVKEGSLDTLKTLIDRPILALAMDTTGRNVLHKAAILKQAGVVEYCIAEHPDALNLADNMSRTALHYAAAGDGAIYDALKNAGADDTVKDCKDKSPADYKADSTDINLAEITENMQNLLAKEVKAPSRPVSSKKGSRPGSAAKVSRPGSAANAKGSRPGSGVKSQGSRPASGNQQAATQAEELQSKPATPVVKPEPRKFGSNAERNMAENDPYTIRNAPTPSSVEGQYIAQNLGSLLASALAEVAEKRPWDPIEYLAHYLLKYHDNVSRERKQAELEEKVRQQKADEELEKQRREQRRQEKIKLLEEEKKMKADREEEERRQKEQEELQKKAREQLSLAQPPDLATVKEDQEQDDSMKENAKEKDEQGRTKLHYAASSMGVDDVMTLLNEGYTLSDRDEANQTARDIAELADRIEIVQAIDNYVGERFQKQEFNVIENMLLNGFDKIPDIPGKYGSGNEDIAEFYNGIPNYMAKIERIHKSVEEGDLRAVTQELDRKKFVLSRDMYGRTPLHKAVLYEKTDIVKYLLETYPTITNCRDNMNRTPLHYAKGVNNEEIVELLMNSGGDATLTDVKSKDPSYYLENNEEIKALKDESEES